MTDHADWPLLISRADSPQVREQMENVLRPIAEREGLFLQTFAVGEPQRNRS